MTNNNKQFVLIVNGDKYKVDMAFWALLENGIEIKTMNSYGGGLMGGGIVTYIVCVGDGKTFRKQMREFVPPYKRKYELPKLQKDLETGKINQKKFDKLSEEMKVFKGYTSFEIITGDSNENIFD